MIWLIIWGFSVSHSSALQWDVTDTSFNRSTQKCIGWANLATTMHSTLESLQDFVFFKKTALKSKQPGVPEQSLLQRWTTDSFQLTLVGIYQGVTYGQWPGKSARWSWVISSIKVYCRRVHLSFNSTVKKKYAEDISRWINFSSNQN